jgi:hypothetical protein
VKGVVWVLVCGAVAALGAGCSSTGGSGGPETVYFLVSCPEGAPEPVPDSYVLPLTDLDDIAHARALIEDPSGAGARIALTRIARGSSDGTHVNRNLSEDGSAWSWHCTGDVEFVDSSAEIYDVTPAYLEEHLDEWLELIGPFIGPWSYTVTRELAYDDVRP